MTAEKEITVEDTISDKEAINIINAAIKEFKGDTTHLRNAIGVFLIGRQMGWKPAFLMFDKDSIRKYEGILDIKFRETMPDEGRCAHKSLAWAMAKKIKGFWKVVKGEIPGVRTPSVQ